MLMPNIRVGSGAILLLATALFAGGPLFAQAPAATDVPSELSKFEDIELRLVRFRINGKDIVIPSTVDDYPYVPEGRTDLGPIRGQPLRGRVHGDAKRRNCSATRDDNADGGPS